MLEITPSLYRRFAGVKAAQRGPGRARRGRRRCGPEELLLANSAPLWHGNARAMHAFKNLMQAYTALLPLARRPRAAPAAAWTCWAW
jgi:hypothetical protein